MRLVLCDDNRLLSRHSPPVLQHAVIEYWPSRHGSLTGIAAVARFEPDAFLAGSSAARRQWSRRGPGDKALFTQTSRSWCFPAWTIPRCCRRRRRSAWSGSSSRPESRHNPGCSRCDRQRWSSFRPGILGSGELVHGDASAGRSPGYAYTSREAGPAADCRRPGAGQMAREMERRDQHPAQLHQDHPGQARSAQPAPGRRHREPGIRAG